MALITRTYTFTDGTTAYGSQVDSEIANIVNTLNTLDQAGATWTNVKVTTLLPQADVNAGGHKVTNLGTPTMAGDAIAYPVTASVITAGTITNTQLASGAALANLGSSLSSIQLWQIVQGTTTSQTNVTSSTFTTTALTATITPTSASHKIKITVMTSIANTNPSISTAYATIEKNGSNLAGANGFITAVGSSTTSSIFMPFTMVYLDSPASTSALTYALFIRSSDNSTTIRTCSNSQTDVIILEEIG